MSPLALSAGGAGLALLAAIAAVVALYLLKPPLRRFVVPSSLIWDRVLRQTHRTSDRLRWWISMLIAAAIAAALVLAIARPQINPGGESVSRLVLVLDNSPTMATRTTDGATRWVHAVSRAREILEARTPDAQVWLADTMRRIPTPGFEHRDAALARLDQLRIAHGGTPRIPLPMRDGESAADTVVIVTDGVGLGRLPETAQIESVFDPVENAGITAFELRPLPADPRRYQAFVEIANASGTTKQVEVVLTGVDGRSISRKTTLSALSARGELIDASGLAAGPIRASLVMPGDGFATDDTAYAWMPVRRSLRVTLVTRGNPWLEKALAAQPRVRLAVIPPGQYADSRDVDAWVFDRFSPPAQPLAPALVFRPGNSDWLPVPAGELAAPEVGGWNATHPLLENVTLRDLVVENSIRAAMPVGDGTGVLVSSSANVPLAWVHDGRSRWIAFGFALEDSNFGLHAAFPVFLNNALDWMVGEPALITAGLGTIEIPLQGARVVAGDGTELPVRAIPRGSLVEIDAPGFFTAVSARDRVRVAASLLDRRITDVNSSVLQASAPRPLAVASAPRSWQPDPWMLLLLAALLLLGFEWWSWNRRVTL